MVVCVCVCIRAYVRIRMLLHVRLCASRPPSASIRRAARESTDVRDVGCDWILLRAITAVV